MSSSELFPSVLGVSIHHALGGRPLWLIVTSERNSAEAQAAATISGHRLHRVLGGLNGRIRLDAAYSAYYTRCNEIAVVATCPAASVEGSVDAPRAAEAARAAVLDAFNGKLSEVTLFNINRLGAVLQMTLRRAVQGFGIVHAIGSSKFDFSTIQISPDQPADDASSLAVRAANDITATGHLQAAADAMNSRFGKADQLSESLRVLKVPVESAGRLFAKAEGTFPATTLGSDPHIKRKKKTIEGTAIPPFAGPSFVQYGSGSGALLDLLPPAPRSGLGGFLPDYLLSYGNKQTTVSASEETSGKPAAAPQKLTAATTAAPAASALGKPGLSALPSVGRLVDSSPNLPPALAASPKGGRSPKSVGSGMHISKQPSQFSLANGFASSGSDDDDDDEEEEDDAFASFGFGGGGANKPGAGAGTKAAAGPSSDFEFSSRPWAPAEDEADDSDISAFAAAAAAAVSGAGVGSSSSSSSATSAAAGGSVSFDAFGAEISDSEEEEEEGKRKSLESSDDESEEEESDGFGFGKAVGRATTAATATSKASSVPAPAPAAMPSAAAFDDIFGATPAPAPSPSPAAASTSKLTPAAAAASASDSSFDDVFGAPSQATTAKAPAPAPAPVPAAPAAAAAFDDVFGSLGPAASKPVAATKATAAAHDDLFGFDSFGATPAPPLAAAVAAVAPVIVEVKDVEVLLPVKIAYQLTETITVTGRSTVVPSSSSSSASSTASGGVHTPGSVGSGVGAFSLTGADSPRSVGSMGSAGGWSTGTGGTAGTWAVSPLSGVGLAAAAGAASPSTPRSAASAPGSSITDQTIIRGTIAVKMMFNGPPTAAMDALIPKELLQLQSQLQGSSSAASLTVPFNVSLKCGGQALTYLSVSYPALNTSTLLVGSASEGAPASATVPASRVLAAGQELSVPLSLPLGKTLSSSSSSSTTNAPFDVAVITYCLAPHPPLVKLAASCRYTFAPQQQDNIQQQQQHKFTDALVKLLLHPAIPAAISGAQLLVQLPPPLAKEKLPQALQACVVAPPAGAPAAAAAASYSPALALFRPATAQFAAPKGQVLWNLIAAASTAATVGAGSGASTPTNPHAGTAAGKPPTAPSTPSGAGASGAASSSSSSSSSLSLSADPLHLAPGRALELKARVGIDGGIVVAPPTQQPIASPTVPMAAQLKFALPNAALAPVVLAASAGSAAQSGHVIEDAAHHRRLKVTVQVASVFAKATSAFKGTWTL